MKPNFPVYEQHLIIQLGVKRQSVIDVRNKQLVRELDWSKDGLKICYTQAAADKLMGIFVPAPTPPPVQDPDRAGAVVKRANFLNRTIILVDKINLDSGASLEDVHVKVKDAYKYLPGMKFKIKRPAGSTIWYVDGREPRYRGRW